MIDDDGYPEKGDIISEPKLRRATGRRPPMTETTALEDETTLSGKLSQLATELSERGWDKAAVAACSEAAKALRIDGESVTIRKDLLHDDEFIKAWRKGRV